MGLGFNMGIPDINDQPLGTMVTGMPFEIMQFDGYTFSLSASILERPNSNVRITMSRGEIWQIGFIQNVISDTSTFTYDNMSPLTISSRTQLLDAQRPGTQAWVSSAPRVGTGNNAVTPWASFTYNGNSVPTLNLSTRDYPSISIYNSFRNTRSNMLLTMTQTVSFRIWLAAKRQQDPPNDPASYKLLAVNDFSIIVDVAVTGLNPCFRQQAIAAFAAGAPSVPGGSLSVNAAGNIPPWRVGRDAGRVGADIPGDTIVVSGNAANDFLPPLYSNAGVSPTPGVLNTAIWSRCQLSP